MREKEIPFSPVGIIFYFLDKLNYQDCEVNPILFFLGYPWVTKKAYNKIKEENVCLLGRKKYLYETI